MNAILYKRFSTDHQDAARQDYSLPKYCEGLGLAVAHTLTDPAESSCTPMRLRPNGKTLFPLIAGYKNRCERFAFVVMEQDRIGRNIVDQITTIQEIWNHGGIVHFAEEGGEMDREKSELVINIKAAVGHEILKQIRRKTKSKANQLVGENKLAGHIPFGFDAVYVFRDGHQERVTTAALRFGNPQRGIVPDPLAADLMEHHGHVIEKKLVDNVPEQEWIHWMRARQNEQWSLSAIARALTQRGVTSKQGKPLQVGNIESILNNGYTQRLISK